MKFLLSCTLRGFVFSLWFLGIGTLLLGGLAAIQYGVSNTLQRIAQSAEFLAWGYLLLSVACTLYLLRSRPTANKSMM